MAQSAHGDWLLREMQITTRPKEKAMNPNPYDRRDAGHGSTHYAGAGVTYGEALRLEGPSGAIAVDDLQAMVASAVARARREEREEADIRQADAVMDAQRRAWAEGRAYGTVEGRGDLLTAIDRQYAEKVKTATDEISTALFSDRVGAPFSESERLEMVSVAARRAMDLLKELVHAQHRQFVPEAD